MSYDGASSQGGPLSSSAWSEAMLSTNERPEEDHLHAQHQRTLDPSFILTDALSYTSQTQNEVGQYGSEKDFDTMYGRGAQPYPFSDFSLGGANYGGTHLTGQPDHQDLASVTSELMAPRLVAGTATSSSSTSPPAQGILSLNDNFVLAFQSADEAWSTAYPRAPVDTHDDDVDEVEASAETHVRDIMRAVNTAEYREPQRRQPKKALSKEDSARWEKWQSDNQKDVETILKGNHVHNAKHGMTDVMKGVECRAWLLYGEVVKVHRVGYRLVNGPDPTSKCSVRLRSVIQQLRFYSVVRKDFLQYMKFEIFAASPEAYGVDKVKSCWSNGKRNHRAKRSANEAEDHKPFSGETTGFDDSQSLASSGEQTNTRPHKRARLSENDYSPSAEIPRDTNTIESAATRVTLSRVQGAGCNRSASNGTKGGFSDPRTGTTRPRDQRPGRIPAALNESVTVDAGLPANLPGA